jgi:hypothetical protein
MDTQEAIAAQQTINEAQKGVNDGQKQINGQLCRVDWMLVEILRLLRVEVAKLPTSSIKLEFEKIDKMLTKAYYTSAAVAEIIPPGCEPQFKADPNWTIEKAA